MVERERAERRRAGRRWRKNGGWGGRRDAAKGVKKWAKAQKKTLRVWEGVVVVVMVRVVVGYEACRA